MSSSTFSSKHEWKVLLVVALAVSACEVGARFLVQRFSDVQHRNGIPQLARVLRDKPSPRVVFLGNSLTRRGVRLDSFGDQLDQHGFHTGGVCIVCPDDTTLRHWHYVFERHFTGTDSTRSPDCVIVTFIGDHLTDQVEFHWRRMALNVGGRRQVLEVLRHDVDSLDDGAYFLVAHFFESVVHQPDMKDGVLRRITPHYRSETRRLNQVRRAYLKANVEQEEPEKEPSFTYSRLRQFIDMLEKNGCHGVFCMIPLPGEQSVDTKLVETIESNNMTFLDFRELASRTEGHYPDGYHMDAVAADIYSRAVAEALAERLPNLLTTTKTRRPPVQNELASPESLKHTPIPP